MGRPRCSDWECNYFKMVPAWQKDEVTGEWHEYDSSQCFHPNASAIEGMKVEKTGGVKIGRVCYACNGDWR